MKPKNKEVNIFNMSLLDILCGALGAFCFMMLVLFQYWKPEGPDVKKVKVDTAQLEQKLSDLMKQMRNMSNLPPEAAARLQQMEQEFAALQGQVAKLKSLVRQSEAQAEAFKRQADQARAELDQARKEANKLKARNPIVVAMSTFSRDHDVDLYVKDDKMEEPDPRKVQGVKWPGDVFFNAAKGPATDVWLMRDVPPAEYKIYYKFLARNGNPAPAQVTAYYMQHNSIAYLPSLNLSQESKAVYVGRVVVDKDYSSSFQAAPEFEKIYQDQRQRRRQQQPPPPPAKQ